ncbi:unnamed protein product [Vitrella brassicaformis CCMP3155]|uniref:Tellurium resistance protein TerC n=1 Tax=Vitrella brassicaformis (strain CCMP3155) TaxID=1169540 RepID=A0A0G4F6X3_VITBC|nr:unnamed protein product [Vitrella brassicaformis CCMP3155]|eukprot:CEM08194.1 unnamed protein product [Vitrella brassicaformis CCMP3155]
MHLDWSGQVGGWLLLLAAVIVALSFDLWSIRRPQQQGGLSIVQACRLSVFWIVCGLAFGASVCVINGVEAATYWVDGYLLEYMLSLDNLFIFHLVFETYHTPDALRRKALFYGVAGAVLFRLILFALAEYFMHLMFIAHLVFGAFLVYSGVKTALPGNADDPDPSQNACVRFITRYVPVTPSYDDSGAFFVLTSSSATQEEDDSSAIHHRLDDAGALHPPHPNPPSHMLSDTTTTTVTAPATPPQEPPLHEAADNNPAPRRRGSGASDGPQLTEYEPLDATMATTTDGSPSTSASTQPGGQGHRQGGGGVKMVGGVREDGDGGGVGEGLLLSRERRRWKATLLFVVVVCMECVDLVFAVDSVSAKSAQTADLFIAYSSTVFAMFGLRSLFFLLEAVMKYFSLLRYGLAVILVYIGGKLIIQEWIAWPEYVTSIVLTAVLALSIVASAVSDALRRRGTPHQQQQQQQAQQRGQFTRLPDPQAHEIEMQPIRPLAKEGFAAPAAHEVDVEAGVGVARGS